MKHHKIITYLFSALALTIVAVQAQDKPEEASAQQSQQQMPPPPAVGFVVAEPRSIDLTKNLPGRLEASRDALVRARVTGIVQKRLFREGAYVKAGEELFKIDDADFRASLASAKAQLRQAQATKKLNTADVKRYQRLVKAKAIPRQQYEQAQTTLATTNANIDIAQAAIDQAQLNLNYAKVTAPIAGYIGQADVTEGALVSSASATQMAQIQQIDPLFINIKQPAGEMLKIKKMILEELGQPKSSEKILEERGIAVKVYLDGGTPYEHDGKLLFAAVSVDAATGEASLRASLPNPKHLLMPGLYVRVEVPQLKIDNAVLVPQQAVTRGEADTVYVINADNTFAPRQVTIAQSQGNQWLITDGLKSGDKVIVDGMQMVMMMRSEHVTPVPWEGNKDR